MQLHIATRAICTYLKNLFTFGTVLHMQNQNRILFTFYLFFRLPPHTQHNKHKTQFTREYKEKYKKIKKIKNICIFLPKKFAYIKKFL